MSGMAQTKAGRALIAVLTPTPLSVDDRLYVSPEFLHQQIARIEDEAASAERERLRAAIKAMQGLIIAVGRPIGPLVPEGATFGRYEMPPAEIEVTNGGTGGLIEREAVLRLVDDDA